MCLQRESGPNTMKIGGECLAAVKYSQPHQTGSLRVAVLYGSIKS